MPTPIRTICVNHVNMVLEGYDAVMDRLGTVFGGSNILDMPRDHWNSNLTDVGRVILEIFSPHDFFLNSRYGSHYLGVELRCESLDEARQTCAELDIRVARELGQAFHSNPRDLHGVSLEFWEGFFHDSDRLDQPMQSAQWWRDEHPLGLDGLRAITIAVRDLDEALPDFQAVLAHELLYEETRPAEGAKAVGLAVADTVIELVAPTGEGPVLSHLLTHSEGIRSTVFGVRDLDQARDYLAGHGLDLVEGSSESRRKIPAEQNLGVIFEFAE